VQKGRGCYDAGMRILTTALLASIALLPALGACSSSSGSASGSSPLGGGCTTTADCSSGLTCSADDPGGQCVKGCKATSDCGSTGTCTDEATCYLSCTKQSDCTRAGYECNDATTIDGKPTATCDIAPKPGAQKIGDSCATNKDCASNVCSTGDPRGQCVASCKKQSDCPNGSTCTDEMVCYKSCTQPSDCPREGYACVDAKTITGTATKTCDIAGP